MNYKKMNKTGDELSVLGFGCMRFPTDPNGHIDETRSIKMVRSAIDNGVNYIDTAYPYHDGESEPFLAKALSDGYREKIFLATKLPSWLITSRADMDKYFNEQLERLQTDYIDYYLIHTLNKTFWSNLLENGLFDFMKELKLSGKVRHIGFSFHDDILLFKEIVDAYDWDFCQIQYNYVNEQYQAGTEGLRYAAEKGLGTIIMEPLLGGKLAEGVPDDIMAIWNESSQKKSPAEWALKWIWNHPEVNVVLSGMSTEKHVQDNIKAAAASDYNAFSKEDMTLLNKVKAVYKERLKIPCTACRYCMPCPNGVDIPGCFSYLNEYYMYNNLSKTKEDYGFHIPDNAKASNCIECGACESHCPQNIPIMKALKTVVDILEK